MFWLLTLPSHIIAVTYYYYYYYYIIIIIITIIIIIELTHLKTIMENTVEIEP